LDVAWCEIECFNDCLQFKIVFFSGKLMKDGNVSSSYLQVLYKKRYKNYSFVAMFQVLVVAFWLISWLSLLVGGL